MKNQFFADKRDFFKYDLLLEILERLRFLKQLTFIPMLTPDDAVSGGRVVRYPCGERRKELYAFLTECLREGMRDIARLKQFFNGRSFDYLVYRDSAHFEHEARAEYFASVPGRALREALVFLDPDNGLEVPSMSSRNADKYVQYSELDRLLARMDPWSILMFFQYLPRQKRESFFQQITLSLHSRTRVRRVLLVSDNTISFVITAKDARKFRTLHTLLRSYADDIGLRLYAY